MGVISKDMTLIRFLILVLSSHQCIKNIYKSDREKAIYRGPRMGIIAVHTLGFLFCVWGFCVIKKTVK